MSKEFWESRWQSGQIGWDIEQVSPPIKAYVDQIEDKSLRILIPGCGNAYEAEYLLENDFENVYIVEISKTAIDSFLSRCPNFPKNQIFNCNFFDLKEKFNLVIEQTFFCAINPDLRDAYVLKMSEVLMASGKIIGVLFNRDFAGGPPFGGNIAEYDTRFRPYFVINSMSNCYNSILPRQGSEVFINLQVK